MINILEYRAVFVRGHDLVEVRTGHGLDDGCDFLASESRFGCVISGLKSHCQRVNIRKRGLEGF